MYHVKLTPLNPLPAHLKCVVDAPQPQQTVDAKQVLKDGLLFAVWLASSGDEPLSFYLKQADGTELELPLNHARPDVAAAMQQHFAGFTAPLLCGVKQHLPWPSRSAVLGVRCGDSSFDYLEITVQGKFDIIQGASQWLFLHNDANRSVEQYQGRYLLAAPLRWAWRWYFMRLKALTAKAALPYAFLVAPAKEMVVRHAYPIEKGYDSPVEQVERLAVALRVPIVYPVTLLALLQPRAFRKSDTHWSQHGAKAAWLACLVKLGVPVEQVQAAFANDTYKDQPLMGDLGNKVYPPLSANEQMLVGFSYRSLVAYDNHLPNFGRVIITLNPQAVYAKRLLIFGSSSTYTMMHYVARTFSEVVFVHSAANVDADFLKRVYADYCLVQSNGRFLVKPPSVRYQLLADIRRKWHQLSAAEQADTQQKLQGYLAAELPAWVVDLHRHTLGAVL